MKKNLIKFLPLLISTVILILSVTYSSIFGIEYKNTDTVTHISSDVSSDLNSKETSEISVQENDSVKEMRGIWIPYMSLALSDSERTEEQFKNKINQIITDCKKYKANTIIVQVRPFGDAIYPSEFFPFSHIISGTQGKSVDYDPLEYIIEKAHENDIAVHAWANLLRIKTAQTPSELSDDNPYIIWQNDDNKDNNNYTFESNGGIYYNPAYPEVRKLIINGISEIVKNYDIDGMQFDDYFYPSEDTDCDKSSYNIYCDTIENDNTPLSQNEWRMANIDTLVSGVYSAVHNIKDNVVFGISPQGNIENDIKMGADVYKWCSIYGYIDYICPQIYVSNEHPVLPFNDTAERWSKLIKCDSIKLYLGLGIYKAGTDADDGTWLLSDDNIRKQIEYSRELKTDGFMIYSYEYLNKAETEKEVQNAVAILD